VLGWLSLAGFRRGRLYTATLLVWATALSSQHFGHVLRGPVTADAVRTEAARRSSGNAGEKRRTEGVIPRWR
jgi:hypothetical protein